MKIRAHRLQLPDGSAAPFVRSPNQSGVITPELLVIHYTAGGSHDGAVRWLSNRQAKASAHLVIGRDGSTTQLVAFNRRAWHAGRSQWLGRPGVNGFSIGIELVNAGPLRLVGGRWLNPLGVESAPEEILEATHQHEQATRHWQTYPEAQLNSALEVGALLVERYGLSGIVGHDDVAPGRKLDPGPAFPLTTFRSALLGRGDDEADRYLTTVRLNIRQGPSTEHPVLEEGLSPLARGLEVIVIDAADVWRLVNVPDLGAEGWVHSRYLRPVA